MLEVSMYMITLLIVIASLTLVECYSTKSEIRFGYCLLYEHRGQLLHGLNKYHLLVGVEMPKFMFYSIFIPIRTAFELWTFH